MKRIFLFLLSVWAFQLAHASCMSTGSTDVCNGGRAGILIASVKFTDIKSISYNGTTQYTDGGVPATLDFDWNQPMWLGAWVYLRSTHPAVDHGRIAIIGKSFAINETPSHLGYHLIVMDNGGNIRQAMLYIITSYPTPAHYMGCQIPNYSIPLNQWFRLDAASLNGTFANCKIWLNGVAQSTINESDNAAESLKGYSSHFTVASHDGVASFIDGMINDPIIANYYPTQADINQVSGISPFDASAATFSGTILSTWRMGDQDSTPTVKDRKGTVNLTMVNGPSIVTRSQSETFTVDTSWTPTKADGTVTLWIDASDNATITMGTGVASIKDKSVNAYVYSQATGANQPTLGTLNGLQALVGNGTQYLEMATPTLLMNGTDRFILGVAGYVGTTTGFPSIFEDGDGVSDARILGFTTNTTYKDVFFGTNGGSIFPTHWNFGWNIASQTTTFTIEKLTQLGNDVSAYRATDNGVTPTTQTSGTSSYGSNTGPGRLLATATSNALTGKLGEIVLIKDPSAKDALNLKAYLPRRWGQ